MRFRAAMLLPILLALAPACKKRKPHTARAAAHSATLAMNDRSLEGQLTSGFYGLEDNKWRWTAGTFSVELAVPAAAHKTGAILTVALNIPEVSLAKLGPITLSASAAGRDLRGERFSSPGTFQYQRELAPDLLGGTALHVVFHLDKTLPPSSADRRELGIVVSSIQLAAK